MGGGARTSTRARQAPAYQQPVSITLDEAYRGTMRTLQSDERRLQVKIPAGVKSGSKVRVAGGGPEGADLYLIVEIEPDQRFEREGDNLRGSASIDLFTAVLGGEAEVQTLEGPVKLKIPAGTQHNTVLTLKGKGGPRGRRGGRGDQKIVVGVEVARRLSARQAELLREFQALQEEDAEPGVARFWEKVKKIFG